VHCWSFFGSDTEDNTAANDNDDDISTPFTNQRRSLSSFDNNDKYTHTIPANKPITSQGRREIEASVKAYNWPTTIFSAICETWAYVDTSIGKNKKNQNDKDSVEETSSSLVWKYLDILVEKPIPSLDNWVNSNEDIDWTIQNSTQVALEAASIALSDTSSTLDGNLLPMSLSLRAHSPHCEMHRSLARDAAISFGLYNINNNEEVDDNLPAAFVVISRIIKDDNDIDKILAKQVILDKSLLSAAIDALKSKDENAGTESTTASSMLMQLPDESAYPTTATQERNDVNIIAILYGQVGTTAFASLYQSLKDSQVRFVVRHMGYIPYEEEMKSRKDISSSRAIPTALQGYGVRLDIRNLEYKAFDEGSSDDKTNDGKDELDVADARHNPDDPARDEYLAGVNLDTLLGRLGDKNDDPLPTDVQSLQTALIHSHPTQLRSESIVPPAWQRRPLSLQATTVITASNDPLETLKGVSQNLPSVAHSLVNVKVPESYEQLAEEASSLATKVGAVSPGWGDAAFGLFVNSRLVDVERPSFNVFQLLDVLRSEDKRLRELELKVRPTLKNALSLLGGDEDKSEDEWQALQSARKIYDLGIEELKQMGKKGFDDQDESSLTNEPDPMDMFGLSDDTPTEEKIRIDVARGGKNAVLYLNDIEKDPGYRSWPTSIQEMMYRSQFGGAPTVRRNLFTMLMVIDPADGTTPPAFNMIGQLLNSQFPLRLGVLIVNNEDVSKGVASPVEPWNEGNRSFNARDSFILQKYISKEYGGMAAISCLIQVSHDLFQYEGDDLSITEYLGIHLSLLMEIGVVQSHQMNSVQTKLEDLVKSGGISSDESKPNDTTYESAVQYAADKLLRPGMSFFNGLPLPDGSDMEAFGAGVNEILSYENSHIMNLVQEGVITDTAPRSIYATVLKGDKVYKQFHPLLKESGSAEYTLISPESTWQSLILPKAPLLSDYNEIDAIFMIDGVFDLNTSVGLEAAISLLAVMTSPSDKWHDTKSTSLAFRLLSSTTPTTPTSKVLAKVFCVASQFDPDDINKLVKAIIDASYDTVEDAITFISQIKDINANVLDKMVNVAKGEMSCPLAKFTAGEDKNFYVSNGRVYVPIGEDSSISTSDLSMLVNMEMDRTHAMTKIMLPHFHQDTTSKKEADNIIHNTVGTVAAILNEAMSLSSASTSKTQDVAATFDSLQINDNPLYFSWNEDASSSSRNLQVKVSVILDPLTEPTQRVAPLLLAIRDVLKLPLRLVIAPRQVVSNDVPLSSYYRFVVGDSTSSTALFQNLPTNHVLTLRMDVPEIWDVQQANAIQDSDNLRCDSQVGCGDNGTGLSTIEYGLKSLLLFGQCYDVNKSTPPNGLKLTLDRSKTNSLTQRIAEVQSDGSQQISSYSPDQQLATEHTDTLVMKTVGYWQLRANPGVWDLRIAEKSRGSEIYNIVEGTVSQRGKIKLAKNANSSESTSKTLVMKDFSNQGRLLLVNRREGYEDASIFDEEESLATTQEGDEKETVHVFSLATGHAYERLLKIMMLSVTKRTSSPVKFWLFENVRSSCNLYMSHILFCPLTFHPLLSSSYHPPSSHLLSTWPIKSGAK